MVGLYVKGAAASLSQKPGSLFRVKALNGREHRTQKVEKEFT